MVYVNASYTSITCTRICKMDKCHFLPSAHTYMSARVTALYTENAFCPQHGKIETSTFFQGMTSGVKIITGKPFLFHLPQTPHLEPH